MYHFYMRRYQFSSIRHMYMFAPSIISLLVNYVAYRLKVMSFPVHHRGKETDLETSRTLTRLPFVPRNTVGKGRRGQRLLVCMFVS